MRVTISEQRAYRDAIDNYKQANGLTTYSLRAALEWVLERGLVETPLDVELQYHLPRASEAQRADHTRLGDGPGAPRVRRRHSVETTSVDDEGHSVQQTFWGHLEDAPRDFLIESVRQRLHALRTDYRAIENDIEGISHRHPPLRPILTQMLLQFRVDCDNGNGYSEAGH